MGLHRQGWQLAIHGNGDDAIQMILNAYEEQKHIPARRPAHRHPLPDRARRISLPHKAWLGVRCPGCFVESTPISGATAI